MAYSGYIWLATVAGFIGLVQAQCDPLTTSNCAPIPGLNSEGYFIDFTEQRSQSTPDQWILANYENVAFGNQGAEFTFNKRFDGKLSRFFKACVGFDWRMVSFLIVLASPRFRC